MSKQSEILEKLDVLVRQMNILVKLVGYTSVKEAKTKTSKIDLLLKMGFAKRDIAMIVGTTVGSVETIRKRLKKRGEKKGKISKQTKGKKNGD